MTSTSALPPFHPQPPDAADVISWVHIGDLHMISAEEQNFRDLQAIVDEINTAFAGSLAFVFLLGDVAAAEYAVVRSALDRLTVPWCAIVGDHDVHGKSFRNFLASMAQQTRYSFQIGEVHFFAMNAFDVPDPGSFTLLPAQLDWLEQGLRSLGDKGTAVLLLHCYPSDLRQGGERLRALAASPAVRLVEMGHTHYNELANDGRTLYVATRSTGKIEEGSVGFSVTNLDGPVVSWSFLELGQLPAVMITTPADQRFITEGNAGELAVAGRVRVRAKVWGNVSIRAVTATLGGQAVPLENLPGSAMWQGELDSSALPEGVHSLTVEAKDAVGQSARDEIRMVYGRDAFEAHARAERDQDNAVGAWPERGLLGTQLGPNKNGRKW